MSVLRILGIMSIVAVAHFLSAMERYNPSLEIEKQLVQQEVARRGERWVLDTIDKNSKKKSQEGYSKERDLYYTRRPTLLKIKTIFFQSDADTDSLTHLIFERVTEIEKKSGYCPEPKIAKKQNIKVERPTNFLGHNTRYYWVNKGKKNPSVPTVKVKSYFSGQESLLEIIQNKDVGLESRIQS